MTLIIAVIIAVVGAACVMSYPKQIADGTIKTAKVFGVICLTLIGVASLTYVYIIIDELINHRPIDASKVIWDETTKKQMSYEEFYGLPETKNKDEPIDPSKVIWDEPTKKKMSFFEFHYLPEAEKNKPEYAHLKERERELEFRNYTNEELVKIAGGDCSKKIYITDGDKEACKTPKKTGWDDHPKGLTDEEMLVHNPHQ